MASFGAFLVVFYVI